MAVAISALHVYPIKSCGGISLSESPIGMAGLQNDRRWMVVTPDGLFLTQRSHPAMALISTEFRFGYLVVKAPGMLRLDIPIDVLEDDDSVRCMVKVWRDEVDAVDEGDLAAQWFSNVLQTPCRLVKVHPQAHRTASVDRIRNWLADHPVATGFGEQHVYAFADGYPVLVTTDASLQDLNDKLAAVGHGEVPMNRFRPNVVLSGLEAFDEDHTTLLTIGEVRLALVKPCVRCEIPNTDQGTGRRFDEPMRTLTGFRSQPGGGVTFGQNAIVSAPHHALLAVGDAVEVELDF